MRRWHSFLEVLQFPLKLLFLAILLYGIGNILTNDAFSTLWNINNQYVILFSEAFMRISLFVIAYWPIFFLLRLVSRKINAIGPVTMGLVGYVTYLVMTLFFAQTSLPATAYSAVLGISVSNSQLLALTGSVHYPLQTGLIGVVVVVFCTRLAYRQSKNKSQYGLLGFIDKDIWGVIINIVYCGIGGFLIALIWPYFFSVLNQLFNFISSDTTNPMNLFVYGVTERFLSLFNLQNIIRQPFWFGTNGGSWVNMVGESVAGDVSIWTSSLAANNLQTSAGRFITPYYVLNIFAVPGMLIGIYSLYTDKMERRRVRGFFVVAILVSLLSGTLLPLELVLIMLCPLLYLFHLIYTGMLFGVFRALQVSLGFNYTGTSTSTAMPGTLLEYISYIRNMNLTNVLTTVAVVGVISFAIYLLVTRLYFRYLATDLFNTGTTKTLVDGTIKAVGGTGNIKMINSSVRKLTIQVFDPSLLDAAALERLGALKVTETRAGYAIDYGAASTIVRNQMNKQMRRAIREVK